MEKVRFGRTGLMVSRTSFGCIPIMRLTEQDAVRLLRNAQEGGINFYDTARGYSDSENKLGAAFSGMRDKVFIATKSLAETPAQLRADLEESLRRLRTDYVDLYQFHNPRFLPVPGEEMYETMLEFQREGKIRFLGITNHDLALAKRAAASGAYDSLQFPLSSLSTEADLSLVEDCEKQDMGLLAMKALSGGLVSNATSAFAFLWQYPGIVPIWGMQHQWELEEFIALSQMPPGMTEEIQAQIARDRKDLAGSFCRSCGYCLPCPVDIDIPQAARMSLLMARGNPEPYTTPEWQAKMHRIRDCIRCDHCKKHCPYHLDTPELLASELKKYEAYLKEHEIG